MIQLKTILSEIEMNLPPDLGKTVAEFGQLFSQIEELASDLKQKQLRYKELESQLVPVIEELKETQQKALVTSEFIVTIKRAGASDVKNYSYKKAYDTALTKVNAAIKQILEEARMETETLSDRSTTLNVQRVKENTNPLATIDNLQMIIDKANSVLAKLARGQTHPPSD